MAHFVELNENNVVIRGIVVNNPVIIDGQGVEREELGIAFCKSLYGENTNWKQTSYNANFRKHYARNGYTYDESLDAFIPPKPFDSWTLNRSTADWDPPIPKPNDEKPYFWNEETRSWNLPPDLPNQ